MQWRRFHRVHPKCPLYHGIRTWLSRPLSLWDRVRPDRRDYQYFLSRCVLVLSVSVVLDGNGGGTQLIPMVGMGTLGILPAETAAFKVFVHAEGSDLGGQVPSGSGYWDCQATRRM